MTNIVHGSLVEIIGATVHRIESEPKYHFMGAWWMGPYKDEDLIDALERIKKEAKPASVAEVRLHIIEIKFVQICPPSDSKSDTLDFKDKLG